MNLYIDESIDSFKQMMLNQDILLQITSKMDNKSLEVLSQTSLWNDIKSFAETSQFWKLRTEHLVSRELKYSSKNWKNIFYILEKALRDLQPFSVVGTSDVTAIKILLDLDYEPHALSKRTETTVFHRAAQNSHPEVMKLLLSDNRFEPIEDELDESLLIMIIQQNIEMVKLLLSDPRVDPTTTSYNDGRSALQIACDIGNEEVVRLLLTDPRVDPSDDDDYAIREAASGGHLEIVKLLLSDDRVRLSEGRSRALDAAIDGDNLEIVELLLSDSTDTDYIFEYALEQELPEVMDLFLKNKKTDLDKISQDDDFSMVLGMIISIIREKALGFYMNRDKSTRKMNSYYKSLVLLLILRRPTFEETLRWILLHPNREMRDAARSLSSGRIDHKSPLISAYLGFLLLAIPDMNLLKIQKLLQSEGASKQGIDLASGLIGAFLGSSSRELIDPEVLYNLLT